MAQYLFTFDNNFTMHHISLLTEKPLPTTTILPDNFDKRRSARGSKENIVSVINWLTNSTKYNKFVRPVDYDPQLLTVDVDFQMRMMLSVNTVICNLLLRTLLIQK